MASTSALSMALPLPRASHKSLPTADGFVNPLPVRPSKAASAVSKPLRNFQVKASFKEKAVAGLTAAALTASMVVPDVAEAASGVSPSLKNFLLSIVAGGVVLTAIVGAVIGVSNFDPVKRS
ncbi:photosystem II subunit X [Perilla frutescens var. hirtella]|nr:photosystem II subunit X [Perilla frutescens var. hirtella]KAH6817220.1 photosystem II subunit X [Perilla frutescens var. frutescens]